MKIGIITILKVNNYGAELQAYATQAFLKALGHDAEIIDYLFYKNPHHKRTALSSPIFRFNAKKKVAEFLYPLIGKIKSLTNRAKAKENLNRSTKRIPRFPKRIVRSTNYMAQISTTIYSLQEATRYGIQASTPQSPHIFLISHRMGNAALPMPPVLEYQLSPKIA